ncbi:GNAT family N-acetyltransferase [Kibdelosporangium phytohabitans]|uniref:GCN5 family acetyltransferase n=1 Tax=Kibdelosporangium phytohabitans TaxID=860235 RepID=A0A0N9HY35_9PSEU|nr:GNAT family N-acetyltransferase [Kibdelosporangium phytohabitans]ALG07033.1 GCN5 family acetyltransferase [Kibdelosporangium phytohabitans]MBE1468325.1 ribosomal protein S18 acetylase RimI-like enzyme [Kibdelosporangium phytohabitans]
MGNIDVRPATSHDAPQVAEIWYHGWRDGHLGNVPDDLAEARSEESFRERAGQRVEDTTVATADGTVAGFVMVVGDEVEQVYVSAGHRGTGIAAALLAEAENQVARNGHSQAFLVVVPGNARARRFYERNGWTDDGLFDHHAAGIVFPAHRYVKPLVQ